jgi:hypothetical protein
MSKPPDPNAWRVIKGRLVLPSGNTMTASCKHRPSGSCGGCHARLYLLVEQARDAADPKALIDEVFRVMKLESRKSGPALQGDPS